MNTTEDQNLYGPVRHIVDGSFTQGDVTAKFYCHNDMREKNFFESWQRIGFNPQTFAAGYYDDYVGNVKIYSLDQENRRRYGVELVEAYPFTIAEQQLDAAQGQLQLIGVTFSYRYWKNLTDEADLPKPLQERITDLIKNNVQRNLTANLPKVLHKLI